MEASSLLLNLSSAPILFFFVGIAAALLRSDLEIPQPVSKFLSIYLLFAIGIKGGSELAHSASEQEVFVALGLSLFFAFVTPFYAYRILASRLNNDNAAATAAVYGSVSAVTFVTAVVFLQERQVIYGSYMVAAMALMEAPAIIVGVYLHRRFSGEEKSLPFRKLLHEALTNGSVIMITGALLVGLLASEKSLEEVKPFSEGLFKGFLALFLLDMGLLAGKRLKFLFRTGWFPVIFGIVFPLANATLAIGACYLAGIEKGNAFLLTILCCSASYIAVPAAMRMAIPKSNPGLFVPMALAITFPFNIVLGMPLYFWIIEKLF